MKEVPQDKVGGMSYAEAKALGERVLETIGPLIIRGELAGSVRRYRPQVHDVDIVVIPRPLMFTGAIPSKLIAKLGAEVVRAGPKLLTITIDGKQVDLYAATEQDWGIQLLRWTGSKEHNIWLCNRARSMGMKLAVSHGLEKDGKVIASRTEAEIFTALGMPWVPPERRER